MPNELAASSSVKRAGREGVSRKIEEETKAEESGRRTARRYWMLVCCVRRNRQKERNNPLVRPAPDDASGRSSGFAEDSWCRAEDHLKCGRHRRDFGTEEKDRRKETSSISFPVRLDLMSSAARLWQ